MAGGCNESVSNPFFAIPPSLPCIIAHRGYWNTADSAQNSIKGLELADSIGVYGSEFDVHITADNIPVVNHDVEINGISIQAENYDKIKNFQLSNGERLPTLEEYLSKGKTLSIRMILEIKSHNSMERDQDAARIVANMVKEFGMENSVEYITFSLEIGKELIRQIPDPARKVALLASLQDLKDEAVGETILDLRKLKEHGFTGIGYHFHLLQAYPQLFEEAKQLGMNISSWTVNDIGLMVELVDMGVDTIITDTPLAAKEFFERLLNKPLKYKQNAQICR
jgi:glycerophosphoryl diester phosphodiesterase